jgi:hypothetical protein
MSSNPPSQVALKKRPSTNSLINSHHRTTQRVEKPAVRLLISAWQRRRIGGLAAVVQPLALLLGEALVTASIRSLGQVANRASQAAHPSRLAIARRPSTPTDA